MFLPTPPLPPAPRDYPCQLTYYQAGQKSADGNYSAAQLIETSGLGTLLGGLPPGLLRSTDESPAEADFAIFVSPEYFVDETKVRVCVCAHLCV